MSSRERAAIEAQGRRLDAMVDRIADRDIFGRSPEERGRWRRALRERLGRTRRD